MKAIVQEAALFLGAQEARAASEEVLLALMGVRAAKRHTCKAESKGGLAAHGALHDAEAALERALRALGAKIKTG